MHMVPLFISAAACRLVVAAATSLVHFPLQEAKYTPFLKTRSVSTCLCMTSTATNYSVARPLPRHRATLL